MSGSIVATRSLSGNRSNKESKKIEVENDKSKVISFGMVQKMINKFLTCDRVITKEARCLRYTEWELAEKLNITPKMLKSLKVPYVYKAMVSRITLPLVRLYCSTKWWVQK